MSALLAPWLKRQLIDLSSQKGHAWLLQGPSGLGQYQLGLELAKTWLCHQPTQDGACGVCPSCHQIDVHTHADLCVLMPETWMLDHEWPLSEKAQEDLENKKPIIVCGDLNVAHQEIDLKNPKTNLRTAGFTVEERDSFDILLTKLNIIDTFRYLKPSEIKYSYWSYRFNSREKNIGWRIDYFLVSEKILKKVENSDILTDIYGSDHAQIKLEIKV
jgi:hypothetical protein